MSELTLHCVGDIYAGARTMDSFGREPSCLDVARAVLSRADIRFVIKFRIAFVSPLARPDNVRLRLQVTVSTTTLRNSLRDWMPRAEGV